MSTKNTFSKLASNSNLMDPDTTVSAWQRNPLWLTMPDISSSSTQRIIGLYRIDNNNNNFVALSAVTNSGPYFVDWGDGTTQSFTSNTNAQYQYSYSGIIDSSTSNSSNASSLGYKQVIISITPSGSNNLISFFQDRKHTQVGTPRSDSKWLEFIVNAPNVTSISLGGTSNARPTYLENVFIHRIGTVSAQFLRSCSSCCIFTNRMNTRKNRI